METKQCRQCKKVRVLSEFYKHAQMGNGYLNICKECKREYANRQYKVGMQDPEWVAKERIRTRERNIRLGYAHKPKTPEQLEAMKRNREKWLIANAHKRKAHNLIDNLLRSGKLTKKDCELCGASKDQHRIEAHHPDYSQPLVVMFLCIKCHRKIHRKTP